MPPAKRKLDWARACGLIVDRVEQPVVLLDRDGNVVLFNLAMEQLIDRPGVKLLGRRWIEVVVPADESEACAAHFGEALAGRLQRFECAAMGKGDERLTLTMELSIVGHGARAGILAVVVGVKRPLKHADGGIVELDYEISTQACDFGRVRLAQSPHKAFDCAALVGALCFQAIHRRGGPCADCPALHGSAKSRANAVVQSGWDDAPFAIVSAEPASNGTRRMTAYFVGKQVATDLSRARVTALADAAGLSDRERSVLSLLLLGRSSADIANALDISERTVKYHQANILAKVGAESRFDLVRLVL